MREERREWGRERGREGGRDRRREEERNGGSEGVRMGEREGGGDNGRQREGPNSRRPYPLSDRQLANLLAVFGRGVKKRNGRRLAGNSADRCAYFGRRKLSFIPFFKLNCRLWCYRTNTKFWKAIQLNIINQWKKDWWFRIFLLGERRLQTVRRCSFCMPSADLWERSSFKIHVFLSFP